MICPLQADTKHTFLPAMTRQQHGCDASFQGSPLETWCLKALGWSCRYFCLAHKFQIPRRKAGAQHKLHCLCCLDTHSYYFRKRSVSVQETLITEFPDASQVAIGTQDSLRGKAVLGLLFLNKGQGEWAQVGERGTI